MMIAKKTKIYRNQLFFIGIFISLVVFIISILFLTQYLVIPSQKKVLINLKKEKIKDISALIENRLSFYYLQEVTGKLTRAKAQTMAKKEIEYVRYGKNKLNYFWIHDERPVMILHPYFKDLENKNISGLKSPDGAFIIQDMAKIIKSKGEGFYHYRWKRRYVSDAGSQKISFIKKFKPWGWIIGTGLYIQDIEETLSRESSHSRRN